MDTSNEHDLCLLHEIIWNMSMHNRATARVAVESIFW